MATQASGLSYNAIRSYAEAIGNHHGVYDEGGRLDLDRLISQLQAHVRIADTVESSFVGEDGRLTVYLPTTTSTRRDRFTIAHELGHYFLHWLYPRKTGAEVFGRGGRNVAETKPMSSLRLFSCQSSNSGQRTPSTMATPGI